MKCLAGNNKIHTGGGKPGLFRRAGNAAETFILRQEAFPGSAHLRIGLHAIDLVAILQKQLAEDSRSGTDVGYDGLWRKSAVASQKLEHFHRIRWPIANIVLDSVGESLLGIGHHLPTVNHRARYAGCDDLMKSGPFHQLKRWFALWKCPYRARPALLGRNRILHRS